MASSAVAERPIPPALALEGPTLGDQLDTASNEMLAALQEMLAHKAIYREELSHTALARNRFFESAKRFHQLQGRVFELTREMQAVSA